jgi:hypothetical protein
MCELKKSYKGGSLDDVVDEMLQHPGMYDGEDKWTLRKDKDGRYMQIGLNDIESDEEIFGKDELDFCEDAEENGQEWCEKGWHKDDDVVVTIQVGRVTDY